MTLDDARQDAIQALIEVMDIMLDSNQRAKILNAMSYSNYGLQKTIDHLNLPITQHVALLNHAMHYWTLRNMPSGIENFRGARRGMLYQEAERRNENASRDYCN